MKPTYINDVSGFVLIDHPMWRKKIFHVSVVIVAARSSQQAAPTLPFMCGGVHHYGLCGSAAWSLDIFVGQYFRTVLVDVHHHNSSSADIFVRIDSIIQSTSLPVPKRRVDCLILPS